MLRVYIAWRLFRMLRRLAMTVAVLALLAAAASGGLAQVTHRLLGSGVTGLQHQLEHAVQRALHPSSALHAPSAADRR